MARLDTELVRRGLARARGHAAELVLAGRVLVDGRVARKASQQVGEHSRVELVPGPGPDYVGRGAHKLAGVLDDVELAHPPGVRIDGLRCLDAGASTGGFTQVLLERGARQVLAVDVGHDQLAPALRDDSRVLDLSGTTVRGLTPSSIGGPVDLVVGDLSFISLTLVLDDLRGLVRPGGELLLLVKPQFEVGRQRLGAGGVVRDPTLRREAVQKVCDAAADLGLGLRAVRASRWPGPSGNVEYFIWLVPCSTEAPLSARPSPGGGASMVIDLTDTARTAQADHGAAGSGTIERGTTGEGALVARTTDGGTTDPRQIASAVRAAVEEGPA